MADVISAASTRPPWTVYAFAGLDVTNLLVALVLGEGFAPIGWVVSIVISGAVIYGLWRGSRVMWWIVIVLGVMSMLGGLTDLSSTLWRIQSVLIAIQLALLLLPVTRRWIFVGPTGA